MLPIKRLLSGCLWPWLLAHCAHEAVPKDFVGQDLSGKINGRDWSYRHAYIDPTVATPEEDDFVFVFLPYVPKDPCPKQDEDRVADRRSIMIAAPNVPKKVTKFKRGDSRSAVFHFERQGEQVATVAKTGKVKILSVVNGTVKGQLLAQYGPDNWVSGRFSAKMCDYAAMQ